MHYPRLLPLFAFLALTLCRALPPDPVIRLDFDAGAMTPAEDGWRLPGGLVAEHTELVDGVVGQALRWTGDASKLVIPAGPKTAFNRQFTVMFWLRPGKPDDHRVASFILGDGGFTAGWRLLQLHGPFGAPYFMYQIGGPKDGEPARADLTAGARGNVPDWLHVAITFDAALPQRNMLVYLDGTCSYRVGQGDQVRQIYWSLDRRAPVVPTTTPGRIVIGGGQDLARGFVGDVDLLRIYDVALDPQEIRAAWSRQRAIHQRPPVQVLAAEGEIVVDGKTADWFGSPTFEVSEPADDFRSPPQPQDFHAAARVRVTAAAVLLALDVQDDVVGAADLVDIRLGADARALRIATDVPAAGTAPDGSRWHCVRTPGGWTGEFSFPRAALSAAEPLALAVTVEDADGADPPDALSWHGRLQLPK